MYFKYYLAILYKINCRGKITTDFDKLCILVFIAGLTKFESTHNQADVAW